MKRVMEIVAYDYSEFGMGAEYTSCYFSKEMFSEEEWKEWFWKRMDKKHIDPPSEVKTSSYTGFYKYKRPRGMTLRQFHQGAQEPLLGRDGE